MTGLIAFVQPRADSAFRREVLVAAGATVLAIVIGLMAGSGRVLVTAAMVAVIGALTMGIRSWRRAVYGLLIFLPVSGVPYVMLYPNVRPASLFKDVIFIIPAYVGFLASGIGQRRRIEPGTFPSVPLLLFALLVFAQILNPSLPNRLVGLIGAKVWLFYLPLCALAYHLVDSRRDLSRLLATMSVVAIVPALVGLIEAALVYTGHPDIVYKWYGGAAESATQGFVQFDFLGGGSLRRIPSTFSYMAQYFSFTVSMIAVTYAWWRGVLAKARISPLGAAVWLMLLTAGFLSGARSAFLFIPFLVGLIVVLEARNLRLPLGRLVVPSALLVGVTVTILGAGAGTIVVHAVEVGRGEFQDVFVDGFRQGLATTLAGLGTGTDTNGARYAFDSADQFSTVATNFNESWYVKAYLELGLVGLVLIMMILGHLVVVGLRRHANLRDPMLRTISASLLAVLIWNTVYGIKGQFMDMDPTNVYFWLFVGVLAKLPQLDSPESTSSGLSLRGEDQFVPLLTISKEPIRIVQS
jgi:hypothetical protein